jgi:hypothetical protein
MIINRRKLITGLVSFIAAPAIVRVGSLMPVKAVELEWWQLGDGIPTNLEGLVYAKVVDPSIVAGTLINGHPIYKRDGSLFVGGDLVVGETFTLDYNDGRFTKV